MFQQTLLLKNLSILNRLKKGTATLEELAKESKCKTGELATSITLLIDQGFIQQGESGTYNLRDQSLTETALSLINPWVSAFDGTLYEIAKDAAKAILTKSYPKIKVSDVMLFGSTLRTKNPRDIDLLIIHEGHGLPQYSCYEPKEKLFLADQPPGDTNKRSPSSSLLAQLGYISETNRRDSPLNYIAQRIAPLFDSEFVIHEYFLDEVSQTRVNSMFDVLVLKTAGLQPDLPEGACKYPNPKEVREGALGSCKDPTFWHTILSEGRLYDIDKHDFTISVEEKYPGSLARFPAK